MATSEELFFFVFIDGGDDEFFRSLLDAILKNLVPFPRQIHREFEPLSGKICSLFQNKL